MNNKNRKVRGEGDQLVRAPFPRITGAGEEKKNERKEGRGEEWTGQALDVEL